MTMTPYNPDMTRALKWLQNNAPNIQSIVQQKANWYGRYNDQFWTQWQANVFDIRTANAFGLTVWCIILGLPLSAFNFQPITNAFAFGDQRGNFQDGGGHAAPFTFVGTPSVFSAGVLVPSANYSINATTAQITYGAAPAAGAKQTWTGTITNPNTGQQLVVQQPRPIGTGDGVTKTFDMFPADGGNYFEVGANFYGGGASSVASLNEIRYACQLRYVALVSNGRIQWINEMLAYIFNGGAAWTPTTKKYFYLADSSLANLGVTGATIYRQDWQGNQQLYSTPRTNQFLYGGSLTTAPWTSGTAGYMGALASSTSVSAPDGSASPVSKMTVTSSNNLCARQTGLVISAGSKQTVSVWMYVPSGQPGVTAVNFSTDWNDIDGGTTTNLTTFNQWVRVASTATMTGSRSQVDFDITGPSGNLPIGTVFYLDFAQCEAGAVPTAYIPTTSAAVTVTDYSINLLTAAVTLASAPVTGAILTWNGTWQGVTTPAPQQFGVGNGSTVAFTLSYPPGAPAPITTSNYMEYRVGANMGLSAQFINLLNTAAYGIMPTCAGIRYAVVQES